MKQFNNLINFKVLIFLVVTLICVDFFGGILILKLFKNSKSGIAAKEKTIFFETDEDVLFFGTSRGAFHYIPSVFEKNIELSFYNTGREGTGIFFEYALLIATIERYNPKMIILDIDHRDVYDVGGDFGINVFDQLAPYYGLVNEEFDNYITRKPFDHILYKSNLIKFNKKILNIVTANLSNNVSRVKGFKSLNGQWNGVVENKDDKFQFSQVRFNLIEAFINKTKNNDIDLIFVVSPTNRILPKNFLQIIEEISNKHEIKFCDFSGNKELMDKDMFHDYEHLNHRGALLFSEILSEELY